MKKSAFSLLMGLFVVMSSFAQESFMRKFEDSRYQTPLSSVKHGDFYYHTEYVSNRIDSIYGTKIYLVDIFGQLIKESFMAGMQVKLYPFVIEDEVYLIGNDIEEDNTFYCVVKHIRNNLIVEGVKRFPIVHPWDYTYFTGAPYLNTDGSVSVPTAYYNSLWKGQSSEYDAIGITKIFPGLDSISFSYTSPDSMGFSILTQASFVDDAIYCLGNQSLTGGSQNNLIKMDSLFSVDKSLDQFGQEGRGLTGHSQMVFDYSGNIYLSGQKYGNNGVGLGEEQAASILKYSPQLELMAEKNLFGALGESLRIAEAKNISISDKGDLFLLGAYRFIASSKEEPAIIWKLDSNLVLQWVYFMDYIFEEEPCTILADSDGGCLLGMKVIIPGNNEMYSLLCKIPDQPIITSIEDENLKISPILISPNPGKGQMRIDLGPQLGACQLELYDMGAKPAIQTEVQGMGNIINTSALPTGTYVYKISNSAGFAESGKWVKE